LSLSASQLGTSLRTHSGRRAPLRKLLGTFTVLDLASQSKERLSALDA